MLGAPALISGVAVLAACADASSNSTPTALTPVPTPGDRSPRSTPIPISTPTPDVVPSQTPSPTDTPGPDEADRQILYVGMDAPDPSKYGIPSTSLCAADPSTLSGLVRVSPAFEIQPDWAESWDTPEDGARWVFRIRENDDGWESGLPVQADDFVRAWRRVLHPENGSPLAWLLFDIENAAEVASGDLPPEDLGIQAADERTIEIQLQRPRYSFPALAAAPLLAPFTGPVEVEDADLDTGCRANGPYQFDSSNDQGYALVPNEGYWDADDVSLERIEVQYLSSVRGLGEFRQGDLDIVRVDNGDLSRARADVNLRGKLETGVAERIWCLIPQIDFPPFEDERVRRALGKMIDRSRLEQIAEGRVTAATKFFPDGLMPMLDEESPNVEAGFDIESALQEIADSPFADPFVWPEIRLTIPEGGAVRERVAQDVAAQLYENLGINIGVDVVDPEEFEAGMREQRYPLTWLEWTFRYPDPNCGYGDLFGSWMYPDRPIVWEDGEYDDLARLADSIPEPASRAEVYTRCEEMLQAQAIYIPLVYPVEHYLVQRWLLDVPRTSRGNLTPPGPIYTHFTTSITVAERPEGE